MMKQVFVLACVLASSLAAPPVQLHPTISYVKPSSLTATCQLGGLIKIDLATANAASSTIAFGTTAPVDAACKSAALEYDGTAEKTNSFATTAGGNLCGRTTATDPATGKATFSWTVDVQETIKTGAHSSRVFPSIIVVSCLQDISGIVPADTNTKPKVANLDPLADTQAISFTLTGDATLDANNHWSFRLKPTVAGSLGDQDFKIKSCVAVPKPTDTTVVVPGDVSQSIVDGGCITDVSATVDVSVSPTEQVISVYPIHFPAYAVGTVEVTCTVLLCSSDPTGDKCGKLVQCPAEGPAPVVTGAKASFLMRNKRSFQREYLASAEF